jgi:conjugative relaxase-like TrwC/TraI family protein
VLSIGKLVGGAEDYYLSMVAAGREEYYAGAKESPGFWVGSGASRLGLSGEVTAQDLRTLLSGLSPLSGAELGLPRRSGQRVAGFDLTFSAPKSISLLFVLGSADQSSAAKTAHAGAVAEALSYLEGHATFARRGDGGQRRIATSGLVAAAFVHRTSRNADPQLHTHVLVANAVEGADGRWSAPDARGLYFHARAAGSLYQASLRAHLVESLGARFGPLRQGAAELEGVDATLLRHFSSRRAEIEEYLAETGFTTRAGAEVAALATRAPKAPAHDLAPDVSSLRQRLQAAVRELGVDPDRLFADLERPRLVELEPGARSGLLAHLIGPEGLTAAESTFERRDVVRAVAEALPAGAHLDEVEALVDHALGRPEVVAFERVGRGGEALLSTRELLTLEARLVERAEALATKGTVAMDAVAAEDALVAWRLEDSQLEEGQREHRPELTDEQRALVRTLLSRERRIEVVVGKAGAGKTTALGATREEFEEAGWRVSGTALSARAASELEAGAGIASVTLARFESQLELGARTLGPRDVVVLDEAGMVGTRALARLLDAVEVSGARLILVGDPRQLPEIEAGGAFATLAQRLGAIELNQNRRQHALWERIALDQFRLGQVEPALAAYEDHGRIHIGPSMAETRQQLVAAWLEARDGGEEAFMLAVNRRDVRALNQQARAVLVTRGSLGADLATVGGRSFATGDEVLCLRNARELEVINGTRGMVVDLAGSALVIETSEGIRRLPPTYLEARHLDYGYASTVHKAQGATYDRAFVLATDALTREAGYVAMSRARGGSELFMVDGVFERGLGPDLPDVEPLARVAQRLSISRAKFLASSHLEPSDLEWPRTRLERAAELSGPRVGPDEANATGTDKFVVPTNAVETSPFEVPTHIARALGTPPSSALERARYDRLTNAIEHYRVRHDVEGDGPLGSRPIEARARLAFDTLGFEIRRYGEARQREIEARGIDLGWER